MCIMHTSVSCISYIPCTYAKCSVLYAMLYVLHSVLYTTCSMLYVICCKLYAICCKQHAICYLPYQNAACHLLYSMFHTHVHIRYALCYIAHSYAICCAMCYIPILMLIAYLFGSHNEEISTQLQSLHTQYPQNASQRTKLFLLGIT
jgi:hypothetical protein